jgi:sarcosine oxidase subunit beta
VAPPSRRAVLIGGGITGTLASLELIDAGWSVTLVEGAHVGAGSSSRTAAGIRQQFSTRETVIGMRYSTRFYREWRERVGGERPPIQPNGYLFLYNHPARWRQARRLAARQRQWGLTEVEDLNAEEVAERFPFVDPGAIRGGTWCPTDGFLRPEAIYNDAAAALRARGGTILQSAPVTAAEHTGGRLTAVLTPRGRVEGDLFLDCTNAWTRRVAPLLGGAPLPVAAYKRYLWFIERGGDFTGEQLLSMPLTITPSGAYCRPENAHSLMVGWAHATPDESEDFSYEDQDTIEPDFFHKSGTDARPFEAWMALADALPPVGEFAGVTATTAGFYGTTPDHNPFLDYDPRVPNLLRLVGFSGHGAMFGPFTALVAGALAEAGGPLEVVDVQGEEVSLAAFRIDRPMEGGEVMVI